MGKGSNVESGRSQTRIAGKDWQKHCLSGREGRMKGVNQKFVFPMAIKFMWVNNTPI